MGNLQIHMEIMEKKWPILDPAQKPLGFPVHDVPYKATNILFQGFFFLPLRPFMLYTCSHYPATFRLFFFAQTRACK